MHTIMNSTWCFVLMFLICTVELGRGFKIFSDLYNFHKGGDTKKEPPIKEHSGADYTILGRPGNNINNTISISKGSTSKPEVYMPLIEEVILQPDDFYPVVAQPYSEFYANNEDNAETYSSMNNYQAPFYENDPYTQYYPEVNSYSQPDPYAANIQYLPYNPMVNKPTRILEDPLQHQLIPDSNLVIPVPQEIEQNIMKKILEIVQDFQKSNRTISDDTNIPTTYEYTKAPNLMTEQLGKRKPIFTERNNTIELDKDELRTEFHTDSNQTETEIEKVDESLSTTTVSPQRYVVEQFIDQNGNPCAKEVVFTSEKKTYYVYTCEEKGLPRMTTSHSNVTQYIDELTTTFDTSVATKDDSATTPMHEDLNNPQTLNDFVFVDVQ